MSLECWDCGAGGTDILFVWLCYFIFFAMSYIFCCWYWCGNTANGTNHFLLHDFSGIGAIMIAPVAVNQAWGMWWDASIVNPVGLYSCAWLAIYIAYCCIYCILHSCLLFILIWMSSWINVFWILNLKMCATLLLALPGWSLHLLLIIRIVIRSKWNFTI